MYQPEARVLFYTTKVEGPDSKKDGQLTRLVLPGVRCTFTVHSGRPDASTVSNSIHVSFLRMFKYRLRAPSTTWGEKNGTVSKIGPNLNTKMHQISSDQFKKKLCLKPFKTL